MNRTNKRALGSALAAAMLVVACAGGAASPTAAPTQAGAASKPTTAASPRVRSPSSSAHRTSVSWPAWTTTRRSAGNPNAARPGP